MNDQGLIGFRFREQDKLAYNRSGSAPDKLGLQILHELRSVQSWDKVEDRVRDLIAIPESRPLDESSSLAETELRRHFPDLEYKSAPKNFHQLYQPLQGSLRPYLDSKLTFMPDAGILPRQTGVQLSGERRANGEFREKLSLRIATQGSRE